MVSVLLILCYVFCLAYTEEECNRNFSVRRNSIILPKASQAKGAYLIHKQVVSMFGECFSLCCSNAACTVAAYENKVNHICFLFNCKEPNVCLFKEHDDYMSMLLIPSNSNKPPNKSKIRDKILIQSSMDAALGEPCGNMRKCGAANSMCTSGTCICQLGFIGRSAQCVRSLCPKPEMMFQCFDVSKSPFCVALYDQCNGLSECGDSSDEINCEARKQTYNESSNSRAIVIKPKPKLHHTNHHNDIHPTANNHRNQDNKAPLNIRKQNTSASLHQIAHIHQFRAQNQKFQKNKNQLAENQLLLLEPKNKPPQYPHRRGSNNNDRYKSNIPSERVSSRPEFDKQNQYSKYKMPSYPRVSKVDEYYQKGSPDQSETSSSSGGGSNRWNNGDSVSSDYEYPSISSGSNRDSNNADWNDGDQYSEPSYTGSESAGKYSSDRNNDNVYYPYYDEESESKPRGRYISDSDRYRSRNPSKFGYEQSMDSNNRRKTDTQSNHHRVYVNFPKNAEDTAPLSTSVPQPDKSKRADVVEDIGSRSMNEWNTAVIALSVGLLIAAALLVAVGLKMRTWRRRLRPGKKGKSLTTDEGDYLINGMYL